MINSPITRLLFVIFSLLVISGCVGLGKQVRLLPVPDDKWQYDPANGLRDSSVVYNCEGIKITVNEVPVRGMLYSAGLVLPIIPVLIGHDESEEKPDLDISITLWTADERSALGKNSVSILLANRRYIPTHMILENRWENQYKQYKYFFDLPRSGTEAFLLEFSQTLKNCSIKPLAFKLDEKVGLGFTAQ